MENKVEKTLESVKVKNFKLNVNNGLSSLFGVLIGLLFLAIVFTIVFTLLMDTPSWIPYLIFVLAVPAVILILFACKKIWIVVQENIVNKNVEKLSSVNWTEIYNKFSTDELKIESVELKTFFVSPENLKKSKNYSVAGDDKIRYSVWDYLLDMRFEAFSQKIFAPNPKSITNLEINNSVNLSIKGNKVSIVYERMILEPKTKNFYCIIRFYVFEKNIETIKFNDFSDLLKEKDKYKLESYDDFKLITIYRLIDNYPEMDNFQRYLEFNNLRHFMNSPLSIPGFFGCLPIKKNNKNELILKLVERDIYFLNNFLFLAN